jgi:hypothetical protein
MTKKMPLMAISHGSRALFSRSLLTTILPFSFVAILPAASSTPAPFELRVTIVFSRYADDHQSIA